MNIKTLINYVKDNIPGFISKDDKEHIYIAGGALVNSILGEPYKDIDCYFDNPKLAEIYKPIFRNWNGYWEQRSFSFHNVKTKLSFNLDFAGPPREILESFDFEHCRVYTYLDDSEPRMSQFTEKCILERNLVNNKITFPVISLCRAQKFISKGWQIKQEDWAQLCERASKVPIAEVEAHILNPNS